MCESVSKGSNAKNIRQVQGLLMLDTQSARLMENTSCLNSPPVNLAYGRKGFVISVASLRKIHRNERRWESNLMAHRTPLTSLACAPFHSWISLGMNDLLGKREEGESEKGKVKKKKGGGE